MAAKLSYEKVDLTGKTAIVTGGNTGIGYVTARDLTLMGANVILACRSRERGEQAADGIRRYCAESSSGVNPGQVEFLQLDLASLQSVVQFVEEFKKKGHQLQLLICNAGTVVAKKELTEDGNEMTFQVNYLSHFLLTLLLLPVLRESGTDSRIINVSAALYEHGVFDLDNIQAQKDFEGLDFYNNTKLLQILNMHSLHRRLEGTDIRVFSLHPGYVETNILQKVVEARPAFHDTLESLRGQGIVMDTDQGAVNTLIVATRHHKRDGVFFLEGKPVDLSSNATDEKSQENLWTYSLGRLQGFIPEDLNKDFKIYKKIKPKTGCIVL